MAELLYFSMSTTPSIVHGLQYAISKQEVEEYVGGKCSVKGWYF